MAPLLLVVLGCHRLESASRLVDGLGDTTVAQALFLGADLPPGIDLPEDSGLYSAFCKVFLAEVTDTSDLANNPVGGADVAFLSSETGRLDVDETAVGEYRLYSYDGLAYSPGQRATVQFNVGGEDGSMTVVAPPAPEFSIPSEAVARHGMVAEVTSGEFTNVIGAVFDLDRGKLVWDSLPDDVLETAELNGPDDPVVTELIIPAEAFPRGSTYVVGLAGLTIGETEETEGVNRVLSRFAAGQLGLRLVTVEAQTGPN
jgi:hypothetical protein